MAPQISPTIGHYTIPPWDLPPSLYFVEHGQSQACRNGNGDFEAADLWSPLRGPLHLHERVSQHVNWANRNPSPFISTFADYRHALNWAWQRRRPIRIYEIDTSSLDDDYPWVFYASDFTRNCFESEFLFLHTIPGHAIAGTTYVGPPARINRQTQRPRGYC
ncbi:hypothetical protein B0T20DRAFT_114419 [Sordaria brevicollis]|uniref:DUF7587 domain-containing protein n=1 Tax=Sordaria brevicollis TaxID=83679 RepID=A0AAE0UEL7_SORBR|nr:hypothetical protein B0T20DRAFT_114419 [Sordaria brevicollis]